MENVIYAMLTSIHLIAAAGCVGGPYYMRRIVDARSKYEKKIIYDMDKLMEDVITAQPKLCWIFLITLMISGALFPVVHYWFHGAVKSLSALSMAALVIKLSAVAAIGGILYYGTAVVNPQLKAMFAEFQPGANDSAKEKAFFALRAKRKLWCARCMYLGILVLLMSAVLAWL